MSNKSILLIEPGYKNKYPPLGLMKIATYHGDYGKKDHVKFIKGEDDKSVLDTVLAEELEQSELSGLVPLSTNL